MVLKFIRNRTSTYLVFVITSAFVIERTVQLGGDAVFDSINKGVSIFVPTVATESLVALAPYIIVRFTIFWFLFIYFSLQKQWKDIKGKYE